MRTEFVIARIRIVIEAPYELNVTEDYALYQAASQERRALGENEIDFADLQSGDGRKVIFEQNEQCDYYMIRMVEDLVFPKMEGLILFQNEMNCYIETKGGEILHFFRIPLTRSLAAWCETSNRYTLTIHYRQEVRNYFRSVLGCFNAAAFENILFTYRKFLFHCSYVDVGGEAVLFSAHSGGGKTTHALLWEQSGLGEMINGDRAVIEKTEEIQAETGEYGRQKRNSKSGYIVHGLPIAGSSKVFKNRSLPLRAIFMLEKAPINEVCEITPSKRFLQVMEQITIHTWDREFVSETADFVEGLIQTVPVRLLRCRPDMGAVDTVRKALGLL